MAEAPEEGFVVADLDLAERQRVIEAMPLLANRRPGHTVGPNGSARD